MAVVVTNGSRIDVPALQVGMANQPADAALWVVRITYQATDYPGTGTGVSLANVLTLVNAGQILWAQPCGTFATNNTPYAGWGVFNPTTGLARWITAANTDYSPVNGDYMVCLVAVI